MAESKRIRALRAHYRNATAGRGAAERVAVRDKAIDQLLAAIRRTPGARWDTAAIARALSLSPSRSIAVFSQATGLSPSDYVRNARMRTAMRMLIANRHSISLIAHHVGYKSLGTFSTAFLSATGVRPSAYRQAYGL